MKRKLTEDKSDSSVKSEITHEQEEEYLASIQQLSHSLQEHQNSNYTLKDQVEEKTAAINILKNRGIQNKKKLTKSLQKIENLNKRYHINTHVLSIYLFKIYSCLC